MAEMLPPEHGNLLLLQPASPGLGTDIVVTMPARVRWWLRSFQATLTTSANVADRVPELIISIGAIEVLRVTCAQSVAASSVFIFGWHEGERALAVTGQTSRVTALPRGYHINAGGSMATATVNLDAVGDQWSKIAVVVEEWIEPLA
ncbi:hypothetical protein ES703_28184 [subsurface metagenome]